MENSAAFKLGIFLLVIISYVNGQSSPSNSNNNMNNNNNNDDDKKLSRGAIVGIILGTMAITIIVMTGIICLCKKCKKTKQTDSANFIPAGHANGQPVYIRTQDMNHGHATISMPPPAYNNTEYTAGPQASGGMVTMGPLPGQSTKGSEENYAYE